MEDDKKLPLAILSDRVTEAHTKIQRDFSDLDPVVGVSQQMRNAGIDADLMTIDCLRSGKRIIAILQDQQPGVLHYQFSYKDQDPAAEFERMSMESVTVQVLYDWMKGYFRASQA